MRLFEPTLDLALNLEGREELIHRSENRLRRELHFRAQTLERLMINNTMVHRGRAVVVDEQIKGANEWEGRDLPGVLHYIEEYDGEPPSYEIRVCVNGQAFEDLRTCDLECFTIQLFSSATLKNTTNENNHSSWIWNTEDCTDLAINSTGIWIKSKNIEQLIQVNKPQSSEFQTLVIQSLRKLEQSASWILGLFVATGILLIFTGRSCR